MRDFEGAISSICLSILFTAFDYRCSEDVIYQSNLKRGYYHCHLIHFWNSCSPNEGYVCDNRWDSVSSETWNKNNPSPHIKQLTTDKPVVPPCFLHAECLTGGSTYRAIMLIPLCQLLYHPPEASREDSVTYSSNEHKESDSNPGDVEYDDYHLIKVVELELAHSRKVYRIVYTTGMTDL